MMTLSRSKKWLAALLALIMTMSFAWSASAAESAKTVQIRVKVGSNQMKIGGESIKIQPPFKSAGYVMVPLSVFTNAKGLGATVKLTNSKVITLTYQKQSVIMTKGSKAAKLNGKKFDLPAAPVDKQGVTMVPLAALVKAIGAKLTTDAKTKELVITGTAAGAAGAGTGIDSDAGKSQIGDSYYKWSLNYPTGLAQSYQTDDGSSITFADVKGNYFMGVYVEEAEEKLDTADQREWLKDGLYGRTVVDIKTITRPGGTFQRMIVKDGGGFFYEYRGIQANGYFYKLVFGIKTKSAKDLDAYATLLDSFRTSFAAGNKSLKDLSKIKNGKIEFANADYGLRLKLPVGWSKSYFGSSPSFTGPNGEDLTIEVYSLSEGDTLEAWVDRTVQLVVDMTAESYRKAPEVTDITWNGIPAKLVKLSFSPNGKKWMDMIAICAVNGHYKYNIGLSYEQEYKQDAAPVLDEMLTGIKMNFAYIEKRFGEVPDPDDFKDIRATTTKTSKKYGYSITVPKYWVDSKIDMEGQFVYLGGEDVGTGITISINTDMPLAKLLDKVVKMYAEDYEFEQLSKENVQLGGRDAVKFVFGAPEEDGGGHITVYAVEKDGVVIFVQAIAPGALETPLLLQQIEDAFKSFQFNK